MVKRLFSITAVLFVVATVAFFLLFLAPGDPARLILGELATEQQVLELRNQMGLDRPVVHRLALWFWQLLHGDLGRSLFYGEAVTKLLVVRLEPSVLLSITGTLMSVLIGVPLGVAAAVRRGSATDRLIMLGSALGMSTPSFWLSLNLILLFSIYLAWTPVSGYVSVSEDPLKTLHSLVLPAASVGLAQAAWLARVTRSVMLEVLQQDFVRTARAKGLRDVTVIYRHTLRNAILPVITVISIVGITLFSSVVVIEVVFAIPGIGRLVADSVLRRDYPTIQGTIIFVAVCYTFINLLVDIGYGMLDPRVKYQ